MNPRQLEIERKECENQHVPHEVTFPEAFCRAGGAVRH